MRVRSRGSDGTIKAGNPYSIPSPSGDRRQTRLDETDQDWANGVPKEAQIPSLSLAALLQTELIEGVKLMDVCLGPPLEDNAGFWACPRALEIDHPLWRG